MWYASQKINVIWWWESFESWCYLQSLAAQLQQLHIAACSHCSCTAFFPGAGKVISVQLVMHSRIRKNMICDEYLGVPFSLFIALTPQTGSASFKFQTGKYKSWGTYLYLSPVGLYDLPIGFSIMLNYNPACRPSNVNKLENECGHDDVRTKFESHPQSCHTNFSPDDPLWSVETFSPELFPWVPQNTCERLRGPLPIVILVPWLCSQTVLNQST